MQVCHCKPLNMWSRRAEAASVLPSEHRANVALPHRPLAHSVAAAMWLITTSVFVSPSACLLIFRHLSPACPCFCTEELNPSHLCSSPPQPRLVLIIWSYHFHPANENPDKYSKYQQTQMFHTCRRPRDCAAFVRLLAVITFSAGWIHPLIHCQSFICHRVSTGNFTIR